MESRYAGVEKRVAHEERREEDRGVHMLAYQTDARVDALYKQVDKQSEQLTRIENLLLQKDRPNYASWIGMGLTMVIGFGSLIAGMTQYVELQLSPIREYQRAEVQKDALFDNFRIQTTSEVRALREMVSDLKADSKDLLQQRRANDRRIDRLEALNGASDS